MCTVLIIVLAVALVVIVAAYELAHWQWWGPPGTKRAPGPRSSLRVLRVMIFAAGIAVFAWALGSRGHC